MMAVAGACLQLDRVAVVGCQESLIVQSSRDYLKQQISNHDGRSFAVWKPHCKIRLTLLQ